MRYRTIELEFRHKVYVGNYESIEPCVRLTADIDENEDPDTCRQIIGRDLSSMLTNEIIDQLRYVHRRRSFGAGEANPRLDEAMIEFKKMKNDAGEGGLEK